LKRENVYSYSSIRFKHQVFSLHQGSVQPSECPPLCSAAIPQGIVGPFATQEPPVLSQPRNVVE